MQIYGVIERLAPGTRKIELFGRPHNVQPNWCRFLIQLSSCYVITVNPCLLHVLYLLLCAGQDDTRKSAGRRSPGGGRRGAAVSRVLPVWHCHERFERTILIASFSRRSAPRERRREHWRSAAAPTAGPYCVTAARARAAASTTASQPVTIAARKNRSLLASAIRNTTNTFLPLAQSLDMSEPELVLYVLQYVGSFHAST